MPVLAKVMAMYVSLQHDITGLKGMGFCGRLWAFKMPWRNGVSGTVRVQLRHNLATSLSYL